jgi:anthranilate phosphoribosyltransferase
MRSNLSRLLDSGDLTREDTRQLFDALVRGELTDREISDLLITLKSKGETSEEIAGAAQALLDAAQPFPRPDYQFADVVGTGGDGLNTINISTAVAFVAAEVGLPVAKHGNRAVSSKCGAADLLEQFGFRLEMSPSTARTCLDQTGVSFLFAPHYHGGIRHAMPVRRQLATRTIFNILGPIVNPSRPPFMLVGVYDPKLSRIVAESLKLLGCQRALVVHGQGLDEIALHGPTMAVELIEGEILDRTLNPGDFGASSFPVSAIAGGTPAENAPAIAAVLAGEGRPAHAAAVAINAAALLVLGGIAQSYADGYQRAQDTLATGKPLARLERCAAFSRSES